ncbi:MAG: phosphoenolpyruvate--protein phosphotransferase [Candidatus Accumulibacter sp.]|jgi:phosphotransferase system enzyme I (PtsI)|nr:phosphoenolpyruvate--protein phosphotransferase [Accumulibacter sp.]
MSFTLHGLAVSEGIAIGQAHIVSSATLKISRIAISPRRVKKEIARFDDALARTRKELMVIKASSSDSSADIGAFIDLHLMLLSDDELSEAPRKIIRDRLCNAEWAISMQMENLVRQFEQIEDIYLRERCNDVRQVAERIIQKLGSSSSRFASRGGKIPRNFCDEARIIVAHDISPADIMSIKDRDYASFITDVGGATSHTAILARNMALPAIFGLRDASEIIRDMETLIVDGTRGVVIVAPDAAVLEEYRTRKLRLERELSKLKLLKTTRAITLDRIKIDLLANIKDVDDIQSVLESGAEGIGLFRSEFIVLGRGSALPVENEQFEAYRKVVEAMGRRPVTIRTFDLGNDKNLLPSEDYANQKRNPALGLRSIRLSLSDPLTFQTQLRAILRVSSLGRVRILIPMLSHAHQIEQTFSAIEQAKSSLREEKIAFDENIPVGGMIEVPASALSLGIFLRRFDFLSIGTNDLIQYTLAVDRSDEQVSGLYNPLHPAVLSLIAGTIRQAGKAGIPISICGELAGDTNLTRLLLGMGLRQFSMHPTLIPAVKQKIKQSSVSRLASSVLRLLRNEEPLKIVAGIERMNR